VWDEEVNGSCIQTHRDPALDRRYASPMLWRGLAWAAGGYLAGTFPSTWLVARAKRSSTLIAASRRSSGETDAHILTSVHLGVGWMALAATVDVLKGFLWAMAARHWGHLDDGWLALA